MSWPYEDEGPRATPPPSPSWDCPTGDCQCFEAEADDAEREVSILLFSHDGERMGGARCRVLLHGHLLNEDDPNADGDGWITVVVPREPVTLFVEWAPASTPIDPDLPYRAHLYVTVDMEGDPDRVESTRRRLHNLGYSRDHSLEENICVFQREYGYERTSGEVKDVADDVARFHDEGVVPHMPLAGGGGAAGPVGAADDSPSRALGFMPRGGEGAPGDAPSGGGGPNKAGAAPQGKPAQPASKGKPKVAQISAKPPEKLPSLTQAIRAKKAHWELVPVFAFKQTPAGDISAKFWMFGEALMWEVPDTEDWKDWVEVENPLPHKLPAGVNRKRLCRLPCTANESQDAADLIHMTQKELIAIDGTSEERFPFTSQDAAPSVLPTPNLLDVLYQNAQVKVGFSYIPGMSTKSLRQMANEYNQAVFNKIGPALTKAKASPRWQDPFDKLGTPGKIWAIHEDHERYQWEPKGKYWYMAGINYGFHRGTSNVRDVEQSPGSAHDTAKHQDYSQIFVAVAGWCLVQGPKDKDFVWQRTGDVYKNPDYAPLVNRSGKPLTRHTYEKAARGTRGPASGPPDPSRTAWVPQQ